MKKWITPSLESIDISETADPGKGNHYGTTNNPGNHFGWGNNIIETEPDGKDPVDRIS